MATPPEGDPPMTDHDETRPQLHLGGPPNAIPVGAAAQTSATDLPYTAVRALSPGRCHAVTAVIAAVILVVTGLGVADIVSGRPSSRNDRAAHAAESVGTNASGGAH